MSTAAPFRLLIQQRITAALKTITPANGYIYDLSDIGGVPRVVRGRALFGADSPLPLVSILQPPHPIDSIEVPSNSTEAAGEWALLIWGCVLDDPVNPTDPAEVLMADVRKRLALLIGESAPAGGDAHNPLGLGALNRPTQMRGNSVDGLTIGRGVVRPADERSAHAYFWLLLMVNMAENAGNPYSD